MHGPCSGHDAALVAEHWTGQQLDRLQAALLANLHHMKSTYHCTRVFVWMTKYLSVLSAFAQGCPMSSK
jgi:hypothetical protein